MELTVQRLKWTKLALPVFLALVFILYVPDGELLWTDWMNLEEFSHGPLMLIVSVYLLWARRLLLYSYDTRGNWVGVLMSAIAVCVYPAMNRSINGNTSSCASSRM